MRDELLETKNDPPRRNSNLVCVRYDREKCLKTFLRSKMRFGMLLWESLLRMGRAPPPMGSAKGVLLRDPGTFLTTVFLTKNWAVLNKKDLNDFLKKNLMGIVVYVRKA